MNVVAMEKPRAFAVWFRDLHRWDVAFFQQLKWRWPDEIVRAVDDAAALQLLGRQRHVGRTHMVATPRWAHIWAFLMMS